MNLYDIAAQIFIKKLEPKYINQENRRSVESLAETSIEAAEIFVARRKRHETKSKAPVKEE